MAGKEILDRISNLYSLKTFCKPCTCMSKVYEQDITVDQRNNADINIRYTGILKGYGLAINPAISKDI